MTRILFQAIKKLSENTSDWTQKNTETSLIEQFLYPKYGPGHFWETVAEEIRRLGGEIHLNSKVTAINLKRGLFESVVAERQNGTASTHAGAGLFTSMPVKDLIGSITGQAVPQTVCDVAAGLPYRDFLTVGLLVKKIKLKDKKVRNNLIPDCWIYIQEPDVNIGRIQVFNNWSPYLVKNPKDTVWLGLEYFCSEGDNFWNMSDEDFIRFAVEELEKLDIVDPGDVLDAVRIKVKKAYPGYFGSYESFDIVRRWIDSIINLYCIGRNGQHRYNNMDHSMLTAIEAVKVHLNDFNDKSSIWSVNADASYHETQK